MRPARASADCNANISGKDEHVTCKNSMNISDIYHSNEEYFRKLKELKAAHIESMSKLEKMYHDKLNLKELEPMVNREVSSSVFSSSVSEKSPYQPAVLVTSLSEPELGRSSSMFSSEEDLPSLEKESPRRVKVMNYARELISNMWTNFSVEDYIQSEDSDFPTVGKTRKKAKEWAPTITIPVPFQMMVREQKKREAAVKTKSEMVQSLLRQEEDDIECKKKFRANPMPAHVLLPLYRDMLKQEEERKKAAKEKNRETLLASQRPFKFIAREEQKRAVREKQLRDLYKSKKKAKQFKARPLPQSIYGSPISDKLKEEFCGNLRLQLEDQELLHNLSLPCRLAWRNFRKPKGPGQTGKLWWKYNCRCQSPGDEDLPEKWKEPSSEHSFSNPLTVFKQFGLHESSSESPKRQKTLADIRADEENLKETRWPNLSPRQKSPARSACAKARPCHGAPPMPTACSRGREQAVRKCEKARMKEYRQEREDIHEKLKKRPLLFEKVAQKNARMAAEKHYSNTLKALGISDEFVSKKGQSGKVLEDVSKQEPKSCTADTESFNEEESIEEKENEEENSFIDTNSQDSCKEEDKSVEESGEENSVEE